MSGNDHASLYGQGLAFPPHISGPGQSEQGQFVWSTGPQNVRESIQIILLTQPGERLRLPDFGAGLEDFLFEPNTVATHTRLKARIEQALGTWEPRVALQSVDMQTDPQDAQAVTVTLTYQLVATGALERVSLGIPVGRNS